MREVSPIVGKATLRPLNRSIPVDGFTSDKLRGFVSVVGNDAENWIAQITNRGRIPWCAGEEREVEVLFISESISDFVETHQPALIFKAGNDVIGDIVFPG